MSQSRESPAYLSPTRPRIFAHRGFSHGSDLIENTLPAFVSALALGATHLESDIQVTRDGVPVLFHDESLERVTGIPQRINQLSLAEIVLLDLGSGARIPTLDETLKAFPEALFNLDFKVADAIESATRVILENNAEERVLVASFSDSRRRKAQGLLGASAIGSAGSIRTLALYFAVMARLSPLAKLLAKPIVAIQVPVSQGIIRFDSPLFVAKLRKLEVELHFWTINDLDEMLRLIELGADGIVTDRTDIAVKTLRTAV